MAEKHEDLRITKSKRDLCNALTELMQTTPLSKITVGDICRKAMINRMTFYKHYSDKYDLLHDLLLGFKKSVIQRAANLQVCRSGEESEIEFTLNLVDILVDECLQNKSFLLSVNNDDIVLTIISTTIETSVNELLGIIGRNHKFRYSPAMLSSAITGAVTFLIHRWLTRAPAETKDKFLTNSKEFLRNMFASKILFE